MTIHDRVREYALDHEAHTALHPAPFTFMTKLLVMTKMAIKSIHYDIREPFVFYVCNSKSFDFINNITKE